MFVTPAVAGNLVFAGSCSGRYHAFDVRSGEVAWTYDTRQDGGPRNFHGDPVITEDLVVTPSDGFDPSFTYAFERATGAVRWKRAGAIVTDLVRSGDRVVGLEQDSGDLVAIGVEDGETAWRVTPRKAGRPGIDNSPVVVGGTVYAPGTDQAVRAVDVASGEVRWRAEVGCRINTGLALEGDDLHLGCIDGRVLRLSAADGGVTAEGRLDRGFPLGRPTLLDGGVVYLVGEDPMSGGGPRFVALDADLGSVRWEATDGATWSSMQPLRWRDLLVVGNGGGEIVALRPESGEVAWRRPLGGTIRGLGAAEGFLFVGSLEGMIYALETAEAASR